MATLPAQAACAAHLQGKFMQMTDLIWEKAYKANRNFSAENLDALAKEAGLNMDKFKADLTGECPKIVQQEQASLAAVGVRGTPAFYINGRYLSGAQPVENFKRIIDEELKKANEALEKGAKLESYYTDVVVKGGKKGV